MGGPIINRSMRSDVSMRSLLAAAAILAALLAACTGSRVDSPAAQSIAPSHRVAPVARTILAARAAWTLPVALSRAVVVQSGHSLVVLGGLSAGGSSRSV